MAPLRVIFMGTPDLAGTCLRALLRAPNLTVAGVVTQPDQPKGRGLKLQPSPVKTIALEAGLPVLQPERARTPGFLENLRDWKPGLIAVAAFGQILPPEILDLPPHGCLNVHTSLLPKYRGAAPIQYAILNGDPETGVTIMKMDPGLDTGPILSAESTPIRPEDNAASLHDRLAEIGGALLVRTIPEFVAGRIQPCPQPSEGVSHARKIRKEDGRIDWHRPAVAIWNQVRALTPWPGAFTYFPATPHPLLLKFWEARPEQAAGEPGRILESGRNGLRVGCGEGSLRILSLQREGGRRMSAADFLAGHPLQGTFQPDTSHRG
ncbi:MAG: methionyl-tRNA formyltransferase [Verrucomicrobiota bacterium]